MKLQPAVSWFVWAWRLETWGNSKPSSVKVTQSTSEGRAMLNQIFSHSLSGDIRSIFQKKCLCQECKKKKKERFQPWLLSHLQFEVWISNIVFQKVADGSEVWIYSIIINRIFLLPEGLPPGFVWLHTLWGQGHAVPRGRTSLQKGGHPSGCEPGGRHLVAGQEGGRLQPARRPRPFHPVPGEVVNISSAVK